MASVSHLLESSTCCFRDLQVLSDKAEQRRCARWKAVVLLQRRARGMLVRRHVAALHRAALAVQRHYRGHRARRAHRAALRRAALALYRRRYDACATAVQAAWRGHRSRRLLFCYATYRRWLASVSALNDQRVAEAEQFSVRSRAAELHALEHDARRWLAFVLFKLHHLLRTAVRAGVYSQRATTELSDFEELLKSIKYSQYLRRLKRKYAEYVRERRPRFRNERLFPVIGDGADYWYLSLADMYELTRVGAVAEDTRGRTTHHAPLHPRPFLWRRAAAPPHFGGRGPFAPPPPPPDKTAPSGSSKMTPEAAKVAPEAKMADDARFHLYVEHYKPEPDLFRYVDFHINILLNRRCELEQM